jgi:aspartate-semialdehyde dehydrogenase
LTVLAVVEPNGLAGTELRRLLRERRQLWTEVRLLNAEADDEVATLSELDGAALVRPLSAEQLAGVDLVFLCEGYDAADPAWRLAAAGTTTVVISPEQSPAGGVPVVAGVNLEAAAAGGLLVSPHPAVVLLALLLDPLRPLGLADATAWLVQPATMHGRRGLDELMEQTRALLAFSDDRPTEVFGDQLTFNLLPTGTDPAPLAAQVADLLGGSPTPAIEVVQGGVFHGFTASLLVGFAEDPGAGAIAAALAARPQIEPHDPQAGPGPGPILAAGSDKVLLGPVAPATGAPGRYWLRAVMDNLTRGGAVNAIEIAAAVLPAPRG